MRQTPPKQSAREALRKTSWWDILQGATNFVVVWLLIGWVSPYILQHTTHQWMSISLFGLVQVTALLGAATWTMHRMEWFGARFQPRLWIWHSVLFVVWLIILVLIGLVFWDAVHAIHLVDKEIPGLDRSLATTSPAYFQAWLAVVAGVVWGSLLFVGQDLTAWAKHPHKFTYFVGALATVAGLLPTILIYIVVAAEIDPSWWFSLIRFAAPIVLLPAVGALTLALLSFLFGFVAAAFFFIFNLPVWLFDFIKKREESAQIRSQKKSGLADYLIRFDTWLSHDRPPEIPDDGKGSRFATSKEAEAIASPGGSPYGYRDGGPFQFQTDKHVLIMASTRGGKGTSVIIPRLLTYEGSMFVLDPKGENARATGRYRSSVNPTVHYLDPFGISGKPKSRFNPLRRFTYENMEAESKALAGALVLGERDHWTGSAQQLLAAVILFVVTDPNQPDERRDLLTVRRLVLSGMKRTLAEMTRSDAADGLVASLAQSFIDTPEKEFGSILSTAQRETEILDNPHIAACLSASGDSPEVDFSEWHRSTMSVFLCLSAPKFPTFNRWLRLVLTSALDEMTDTLNPPPLPVCFMLDELATLGHLGVVENAVGLAAGYGVQLVTVFQDVAQMRDLYKGRWASFIGNAGIRALFNLADFDTADYWSRFIGGRTTDTLNLSQDIYGITKGQSRGETTRPLLTPDELMLQFSSGKMLLLPEGKRPVIVDRKPYFLDPMLAGRWDDPRGPLPQPIPETAEEVPSDSL